MSWTYDETDLATDLNFIRYKLGDTTQDAYSPSNELVAYWLAYYEGDKFKAAAELARNQALKFAKLSMSATDGTVKIGGMSLQGASISYAQAKDFYTDLAEELDGQATTGTGAAVTPSWEETDHQFYLGMMDNPGNYRRDPNGTVR